MIQIDLESQEPLVEQVVHALKGEIASGRLPAGQELPSARQLGGDLGVHFNTVARAYRQLSEMGLLFVAHGRKTYVRDFGKVHAKVTSADREQIRRMLRDALTQAQLVGLSLPETQELLKKEIEQLL